MLVNDIAWFLGANASIDGAMTMIRGGRGPPSANAAREKT